MLGAGLSPRNKAKFPALGNFYPQWCIYLTEKAGAIWMITTRLQRLAQDEENSRTPVPARSPGDHRFAILSDLRLRGIVEFEDSAGPFAIQFQHPDIEQAD
jgi:hypothetical protein